MSQIIGGQRHRPGYRDTLNFRKMPLSPFNHWSRIPIGYCKPKISPHRGVPRVLQSNCLISLGLLRHLIWLSNRFLNIWWGWYLKIKRACRSCEDVSGFWPVPIWELYSNYTIKKRPWPLQPSQGNFEIQGGLHNIHNATMTALFPSW